MEYGVKCAYLKAVFKTLSEAACYMIKSILDVDVKAIPFLKRVT